MKKHKLAFVDIETTGLDIDKHEILSIGVVLVEQDWSKNIPVFEKMDEFELKIKPENIENADPISLKVNKYNPEDWVSAYTLKKAMNIFSKKTEGVIMVSHNITFDYGFIEKAFKKTEIENKMHYHKIDTISLSFAKLHGKDDIDKFSLRNLCEYFDIENKNAHNALSDAHATFMLYRKLFEM
ncbi:MAG: 3'-5' exonuclease [Candidatus Pacebacteria bacterium]|nr:3'-5' exonuclease [Candidatus Paceibacterota bacterium]MCF7862927.1 3'-5' exonuclease [Candidatus Paceibacterota bacterium]